MTQPSQHIEKKCCRECFSDGRFTDEGCVNLSCKCHSPIEKNWETYWVEQFIEKYHGGGNGRRLLTQAIDFIRREKQLSYQAGKDAERSETADALKSLSRFVAMNQNPKEAVITASMAIQLYEDQKRSNYIRFLEEQLAARSEEGKTLTN